MPIRVECDVCGARYRVDDRRSGTEIPCKDCDADIWVPEMRRRGPSRRPARGGGRSRGRGDDGWDDFEDEPREATNIWANPTVFVVCLIAGGLVVAGIVFGAMYALKSDPAEPPQVAQNDSEKPEEINPAPNPNPRPRPNNFNPRPNPNPVNPQPKPKPEPINKPQIDGNPLNKGAIPMGFQPPENVPADLPPDLAGTWEVQFDPVPEPITAEPDRKLRVPFPGGVKANEVLWPNSPSYFVGLGSNTFDRDFREVYDIRNHKKLGRIFGFGASNGKSAISPDGKFYAVSNRESKGVYVWDVENSKPKGTLALASTWGAKVVQFAGTKRLAAMADSKAPLQIWSLPSGNPEKTITLPPETVEGSITFSHGGKYVAAFNKERGHPAIHLFDLDTGKFAGAISVPLQGDNDFWVPNCHVLMFSPDGEEIAGIFEESFKGKYFYSFSLKDGSQTFNFKFDDDNTFWWLTANSTPIQWFPNKKRWLLFGNMILDRDVGKVVWKFSKDQNAAAGRRVLTDDVMIGATLEKGKPTMLAFSVDEEKIGKVAETVGAGGKIVDAKLPPLTGIDRAGVQQLSLDATVGDWTAGPDPFLAGESELKDSVSVTATGGRMTNLMLSNAKAGRAIVYSLMQNTGRAPRPGRPSSTKKGTFAHLDIYNLQTGRRSDQMDLTFPTQLAAYSPSGSRIATLFQPENDRIDIWTVDDGKPVLAFRPYHEEEKSDQRVMACAFVDDDHLVTLSNQRKLVMWKLPECKAVYEIANANEPGLSPNQKYLAVSTGQGYLLLDSRTGKQEGRFNIEGVMHVAAFHPDGKRFAASCTGPRGPSIVIWSMEDGSVLSEFPIQRVHTWFGSSLPRGPSIPSSVPESIRNRITSITNRIPTSIRGNNQSMHFCHDDHLLINNSILVDVKNELIVWKYRLANGAHSPQSPDGRHWYITPKGASGAELIAAKLPEPQVAEFLAKKELKPDFLLQPGGQVSTQINIPDSGPGQSNLRQRALKNLVEKYQNTGTSVGGGSDLVIAMDMTENDTGKSQELVISKSRTPFGGGIFNQGGEEVSVSLKNISCKITFTYQGKLLNERKGVYSNQVSRYFGETLKDGESADEHLEKKMWGSAAAFFTGYSPPVYVFRDFEGKGFGLSTLSDRGPLPQGVGG